MTKSGGGKLSDLHPNWQYVITMVANLKYGKIEELTFENGIPVNCKLAVQNINIGMAVAGMAVKKKVE